MMIVILSIMTVIVTIAFAGIAAWAWSGKNKTRFDEAARIPLEEDDEVSEVYLEDTGNG